MKEKIIELFESNRGEMLSGGNIASTLGISRAAVWKWISILKEEGHLIDSTHGQGYRLKKNSDVLSEAALQLYGGEWRNIILLQSTPSTNMVAKELAAGGAAHGTVVIAEGQTAGRGRMGRSFYSPKGAGLYFSVILRPEGNGEEAQYYTAAAAVAVAETLRKSCRVDAKIKWVNDILIEGKKVCGILSEGSYSMENGCLDYVVVGIGINVIASGFPAELGNKAAALSDYATVFVPRVSLAGEILKRLDAGITAKSLPGVVGRYKELSAVVGRKALIRCGDMEEAAEVVDIDSKAGLVVKTAAGTQTMYSGEITLLEEKG